MAIPSRQLLFNQAEIAPCRDVLRESTSATLDSLRLTRPPPPPPRTPFGARHPVHSDRVLCHRNTERARRIWRGRDGQLSLSKLSHSAKITCRRCCSSRLPVKLWQLVQKGDGWAANAACSKRSCTRFWLDLYLHASDLRHSMRTSCSVRKETCKWPEDQPKQ